jgi:hypothetical protein
LPDLDCSPGAVIHVEDFKAEGFETTDKFVFIVGPHDKNTVLAFVITKQKWNLQSHAKEIVVLPQGSVAFLPHESYIQCFSLHRLDLNDLRDQFTKGKIQNKGNLGDQVLIKVLDVVADSDLLSAGEIQEVFAVLSNI